MNNDKDTKEEKKRSTAQNKALHKFCELLADELNNAGLDMKKVLKPNIDIPWNKDSVKEYLWKPVLEAVTMKNSTTEMSTTDPDKVWELLNRHIGEKFGVEIPEWPNETHSKEYIKSLMR